MAISGKHERALTALARALRDKGFKTLCSEQETSDAGARVRGVAWAVLTYGFAIWATMACSLSLVSLLELPWWTWSLVPAVAVCVVIVAIGPPAWVIHRYSPNPAGRSWFPITRVVVVMLFLLVAVLLTAVITATHDVKTAAITHGGTAGALSLWIAGYAVFSLIPSLIRRARLRRIGRSLTLASSILLVILFVPLFSQELWRVANGMSPGRAVGLAAVTVVPLFCLLCWQLSRSIEDAFRLRAEALGNREYSAARQFNRLLKQYPEIGQSATDPSIQRDFKESYEPRLATRRAPQIARRVKRSFHLPLVVGLVPVVLGLWALMSGYIYMLASITIDVDQIGEWLATSPGDEVAINPWWEGSVLGVEISLPGHPYPVVALLLGVVLAAIFLASTLTEEHYKSTLADTALHGRVEECLLIALPYVHFTTPNDSRAAAEGIEGAADERRGDNSFAANDDKDDAQLQGIGVGKTLWYRWRAPSSEHVLFSVETKEFRPLVVAFEHLERTPVAGISLGGVDGRARFAAAADHLYDIAVDGHRDGHGSGSGRFTLQWAPSPAPTNDAFAKAQLLVGREGQESGDSTMASKEADEPDHAGNRGGKSLWYRWTAERTEGVTFETTGSSFDTLLAVYTGDALDRLSPIASNDDAIGLTSQVRFDAQAGTDYHVAVDGYAPPDGHAASGHVALLWSPAPHNDDFASAHVIEGRRGQVNGNNRLASREPDEPLHAGAVGGRSLWYRWTAPRSEWMVFDTKGASFDTLLAVYTGLELNDLAAVAANDDAFRLKGGSRVRFRAHEGTVYHVAVDGFSSGRGSFALRWFPASPAGPLWRPRR